MSAGTIQAAVLELIPPDELPTQRQTPNARREGEALAAELESLRAYKRHAEPELARLRALVRRLVTGEQPGQAGYLGPIALGGGIG